MSVARNCTHENAAPAALIDELPDSQAGLGRHKCTICAYVEGKEGAAGTGEGAWESCKHGSSAPVAVLAGLPESQKTSEGRHRCAVCAYAAGLQDRNTGACTYPDELPPSEIFPEGLKKSVVVNAYERNDQARRKCIEHYGVACGVCSTNLESVYGHVAAQFIHVHHVVPVSQIGKSYNVDPVKDLIPVCPNCHSILHRRVPPYSVEEVRGFLQR